MVKVLMVCLGNICRSPLAEGILKSKVNSSEIHIDSAGTGGWHIGELPDSRSIDIARTNGIDISDQACRKFIEEDFDVFDYIYDKAKIGRSGGGVVFMSKSLTATSYSLLEGAPDEE